MHKLISLSKLKILHRAGGVLKSHPCEWGVFKNVPKDLIEEWKNYLNTKDRFNAILESYGFENGV